MFVEYNIAGSSKGRIVDSESAHLGSNPSPAALRLRSGLTAMRKEKVLSEW